MSVDERMRLRPVDEQLLRVALLPTDEVATAWTELRQTFAPEELDDGRGRATHAAGDRRAGAAGVDDPDLGRMRGIRRHTFFAQQLLRADLVAALDVLDAAGVRSLALKGVPLVLEHYGDVSLRPMWDVDLLIDADRVPVALAALRAAQWRNAYPEREHSCACTRRRRCGPLTAGPSSTSTGASSRGSIGTQAPPIPSCGPQPTRCSVDGRRTLAPAPEDLVLHVILHAFRTGWRVVPRRVADVAMVLRSAQDGFDWDRFVRRATQGRSCRRCSTPWTTCVPWFRCPYPTTPGGRCAPRPVDRVEAYRYQVGSRLRTGARRPVVGQLGDLRVLVGASHAEHPARGAGPDPSRLPRRSHRCSQPVAGSLDRAHPPRRSSSGHGAELISDESRGRRSVPLRSLRGRSSAG